MSCKGFQRLRHYGLFASANRADDIALGRRLPDVPHTAAPSANSDDTDRGSEAKSRTLVLAAAGAWSSSSSSTPAASRRSGRPHRSASTAHDHNALAASPITPPGPRSANRNRQRPLRPTKTQIAGPDIAVPIPPNPNIGRPRSRHPRSQSPDRIRYRRQIPID